MGDYISSLGICLVSKLFEYIMSYSCHLVHKRPQTIISNIISRYEANNILPGATGGGG